MSKAAIKKLLAAEPDDYCKTAKHLDEDEKDVLAALLRGVFMRQTFDNIGLYNLKSKKSVRKVLEEDECLEQDDEDIEIDRVVEGEACWILQDDKTKMLYCVSLKQILDARKLIGGVEDLEEEVEHLNNHPDEREGISEEGWYAFLQLCCFGSTPYGKGRWCYKKEETTVSPPGSDDESQVYNPVSPPGVSPTSVERKKPVKKLKLESDSAVMDHEDINRSLSNSLPPATEPTKEKRKREKNEKPSNSSSRAKTAKKAKGNMSPASGHRSSPEVHDTSIVHAEWVRKGHDCISCSTSGKESGNNVELAKELEVMKAQLTMITAENETLKKALDSIHGAVIKAMDWRWQ
jgi:hypothetical protein